MGKFIFVGYAGFRIDKVIIPKLNAKDDRELRVLPQSF
jgi:hypothetical protein